MRQLLALVVFASFAIAPAASVGRPPPNPFPRLPRSELQIVTDSGTHSFQVWIAADDQSRMQGLMNVRSLPAEHGMLFLFEQPQFAAFWMKDTYLSLDLVFIGLDGIVVNVARKAEPLSLQPIRSAAPVIGVLELVAGTAARIGLSAGDRVLNSALSGSN